MSQPEIQPSKAEDLRLQKAQQIMEYLLKAANQNETLKRQLETVTSSENLVEIAIHHGYELTVADLETLRRHRQQPAQLHSDELDSDELTEQELELVTGGSGFYTIVFSSLPVAPTQKTKR